MTNRTYMDHSATTPTREEVVEAMRPCYLEQFGNASSVHGFGQEAHARLEEARERVAARLGASPAEIILTSGGTESDNLALKGVALAMKEKGRHIITSTVEHLAVLKTCSWLENNGFEVTRLSVDGNGRVDPEDLRAELRSDTVIVSVMLANNEVGVLQPISDMAAILEDEGSNAVLHTDAVQAVGKIPVNVDTLGVDLMSVSGHKFYGPKGVGVLYRREGTRLSPVQHGGHHENNLRAGTQNVPGAVGLATALDLACEEREGEAERLRGLRDRLQHGIMDAMEDVYLNGHSEYRLPHLLNVSIVGVEGESLLLSLDAEGIAVSTGSACTSGTLEPSHVLTAMDIPAEIAHGSLRFSLGRVNTEEDVDYVLQKLPPVVQRLRDMSPTYEV
ncbi:MAG: cysteine desulfurase NifS [Candidatus Brocadiia bacterium]